MPQNCWGSISLAATAADSASKFMLWPHPLELLPDKPRPRDSQQAPPFKAWYSSSWEFLLADFPLNSPTPSWNCKAVQDLSSFPPSLSHLWSDTHLNLKALSASSSRLSVFLHRYFTQQISYSLSPCWHLLLREPRLI